MELNLERSDYAKVAAVLSAAVFVASIIAICVWYGDEGFIIDTVVAASCATVCAVMMIMSSWFAGRNRRADRRENVEVVYRFVPGDGDKPREPEKTPIKYKMPEH